MPNKYEKALSALNDCDHEPYGQVTKESAYNFVNAYYDTIVTALTQAPQTAALQAAMEGKDV